MINIKKDWVYEAKWTYFVFVGLLILFFLLSLFNYPDQLSFAIGTTYRTVYQMTNLLMMFYPAYSLMRISPKLGKVTDSPLLTTHLPFTKKQLWYKSIKRWFICFPSYYVLSTALYFKTNLLLLDKSMNDAWMEFFVVVMVIFFIVAGISLQFLAGLINSLAKQVAWYKYFISGMILNTLFVFAAIGLANVWKLDGDNMKVAISYISGVMIVYLLLSVSVFVPAFKSIEKIDQ
ncbi:MAG: hypothetical protein ACRCST_07725 [Turicibacter sp.]